MGTLPNKWTAFWLSLLLPGAGQAAARSWTAVLWLPLSIAVAIALANTLPDNYWQMNLLQAVVLGAIGLLSAEHAKRLLEQPIDRQARRSTCLRREVICRRSGGRSIDVLMTLKFARRAPELWNIISDLPTFLIIDPFHDRVVLQRLPAGKGVDLVLSHNAFGLRFLRFGRIVAWNEGHSYTFSDLSGRAKKTGFPHVFVVAVEAATPDDRTRSLLTIRVRGRWTSRIVPLAIGHVWVPWVCREHARLLAKAL